MIGGGIVATALIGLWWIRGEQDPPQLDTPVIPSITHNPEDWEMDIERNISGPGPQAMENLSWVDNPEIRKATETAFRRIHFQQGGEEQALLEQEEGMASAVGVDLNQRLENIPELMREAGMVPPENMKALYGECLLSGRLSLSNVLTKQRSSFESLKRGLESGKYHIPLQGMEADPLAYSPECYAYRFSKLSPNNLPSDLANSMGQQRDNFLRQRALLVQEQKLLRLSMRLAAQETGVTFPNSQKTEGWSAILPEYKSLQEDLRNLGIQYEQAMASSLVEAGFPIQDQG